MRTLLTTLFFLLLTCPLSSFSEIKVGVSIPLSGALAEYGKALQNGFTLARKDDPEMTKNVELVFEDNRYDNTAGLTTFRKFESIPDISLAYVWGYGPCQAVIPVAESSSLPLIAVTAEEGVNIGKKNVIRFGFRVSQLAEALIKHLRNENIKRIGIIKSEIAFMNGNIEELKKRLNSDESIEVVQSFQVQDNDFRSTVEKLKSKNFDAIGVLLVSGQISQFYREANNLNFHPKTFGSTPFENLTEKQFAGGGMEGAVFPTLSIDPEFEKRYMAAFGNNVQVSWAANAYDFVRLVGKVANGKEKVDRKNILKLLSTKKLEDGAQWQVEYIADGKEGNRFKLGVDMKEIGKDRIRVLDETVY